MYERRLRRKMEDAGELKVLTTKRTWWRMAPTIFFSMIVFVILAWFVVQVPRLRSDLRIAAVILAVPIVYLLWGLLKHISTVYAIGHSMIEVSSGIINFDFRQTLFTQVQNLRDDPTLIGGLLGFTELMVFLGHEEPIKMPRCPRAFADELRLRWKSGGIGPGSTGAPPSQKPPTTRPPKSPAPRRRGLTSGRRRGYG